MDNLEQYISDHRDDFDTELPNLKVWASIEKKLAPAVVEHAEAFIKENRVAFDTEIPNLKVWARIDKILNRPLKRQAILRGWFLRVAAAAALLIMGAMGGFYLNEKTEAVAVAQKMEAVSPDFKQTERFYNKQVQEKLAKLARYENTDPSVLADLKQIDAVQEELKAELKEAPTSTRAEIVHRVIQNYQIKLSILERVLEQIDEQKINDFENQKNPQRYDSL